MTYFELILKLMKKNSYEYLSAKKIEETFGISLSFVYALVENEKIETRIKYGRKEIHLESFLKTLEIGSNIKAVENLYTKEDCYANNYYNWGAKNEIEKFLENLLIDELGEFTSVKNLVNFLGLSKTTWHDIISQNKIICLSIQARKIIITRSLLPYFREGMLEI